MTLTRKVAQPLTPVVAAELIRDLGSWRISTPAVQDVLAAIDLQTEYQLSFWDAMVIRSTLSLGCSILWSEDLSDGQAYRQLVVKNPFQVD